MHGKPKKPGFRISLDIELPMPSPEQSKRQKKPSFIEKVGEAITMIDSGHESKAEWDFIRCLNNCLMNKKTLTEKQKKLLKMIQPVLKRYKNITSEEILQDSEKLSEADALITSF